MDVNLFLPATLWKSGPRHRSEKPDTVWRAITSTARSAVRAARPGQWVKNAVVITPLLSLGRPPAVADAVRAGWLFVVWCLIAGSVYLINDVTDRDRDRMHPRKRHRPVASGELSVGAALMIACALAISGVISGAMLSPLLLPLLLAYPGYMLLYSRYLKHLVWIDLAVLVLGFLIRLYTAHAAFSTTPSPWLTLMVALSVLCFGCKKRRAELGLDAPALFRPVLRHYKARALDRLMAACLISIFAVVYVLFKTTNGE